MEKLPLQAYNSHTYQDAQFGHSSIRPEGWVEQTILKTVFNIHISESIPTWKLRHMQVDEVAKIKVGMMHKIGESLYENGFINFTEMTDNLGDAHVIDADVNVVPFGPQYVNYVNKQFQVGDQIFTNEELIEAVKKTYPEKFI